MKIFDFIEHINANNELVFKHPCEDFNTSSKLIVREGQNAVFVKNGKICDIFEPGRYKLSTENIPIIKKIMSLPTNGESTFSAEIYFVSVINVMNLKWGTANKMQLQDPIYKIILSVGASGEASFRITNVERFFKTIVGTTSSLENDVLIKYFRSLINSYIKNAISDSIVINNVSLLNINSCLISISNRVKEYLNGVFDEYGVTLKILSLENIVLPEDDSSLIKLKETLSKKSDMDILGYTYKEDRGFDVLDKMAANEGSGAISTPLMGIGVGLGMGNAIGGATSKMANGLMSEEPKENIANKPEQPIQHTIKCSKCGCDVSASAKFCSNCGAPIVHKRFCSNCGFELGPNMKFCPNCGEKNEN